MKYNNINSTGYRQKGHENREALETRLRQLTSFGRTGESGGKILISCVLELASAWNHTEKETTTQQTTTAI